MPYVRPTEFTEPQGWHQRLPSPGGAELEIGNINLSGTMVGVAFYNPPFEEGGDGASPRHFEKPALIIPGMPAPIYAFGPEPTAMPGETATVFLVCTHDPTIPGSGQAAGYYPVGTIQPDGSTKWPQNFTLKFYAGTVEWFEYIRPVGDGPVEPSWDPLNECEPLEAEWPYVTPYLTALAAPPGVVRRVR